MALSLPQIRYAGVESLGRKDIEAPLRTARARSQAAMAVAGSVEKWATAEVERNTIEAAAQYIRAHYKELGISADWRENRVWT